MPALVRWLFGLSNKVLCCLDNQGLSGHGVCLWLCSRRDQVSTRLCLLLICWLFAKVCLTRCCQQQRLPGKPRRVSQDMVCAHGCESSHRDVVWIRLSSLGVVTGWPGVSG